LAREHPLELEQVQLMATRGESTPVSGVKDAFTGSELEEAGYLTWTTVFKNNLAGIANASHRVEARILDPAGTQLATGADAQELPSTQNKPRFHSTIMFPTLAGRAGGQYRFAFVADNRKLGEYPFLPLCKNLTRWRLLQLGSQAGFDCRSQCAGAPDMAFL
jgi:hypothetical protein